jgi:DNA-binding CsgD family transcriptional regulator
VRRQPTGFETWANPARPSITLETSNALGDLGGASAAPSTFPHLESGSREAILKKIRKSLEPTRRDLQSGLCSSQIYVFCEKETGAARFQVRASSDGTLPLEEAASLLAMHCLVRGQSPHDYQVMVRAGGSLFERVTMKARQLLEAGRAIACPVALSRREKEVLEGVLENLANKEIASRLSISERTVKFHVSSLFVKFKVRSRIELMRKTPSLFGNVESQQPGSAVAAMAADPMFGIAPRNRAVTPLDRRERSSVELRPKLMTA